ncbi:tail fiber assembly protein [Citrobacter werkmanii]|uniref:tail fiber assembly protein n=1 Tax=Citrobacter TaxID=544 RepID=UPI001866ECC4|nr:MULTISPECIES: tail fiber assembly protein [Citrobacter]MEC3934184.1 tail fiber assembly protein [Citrobacter farmeri]
MKYFKDDNNNVYAYESDGSQDDFIKPGLVAIDEEEAFRLANPKLTPEQIVEMAKTQKAGAVDAANEEIAWRQDAVDLDIASDEEKAELLEWKKYRVLLSRVKPEDAPDIRWPDKPA